MTSAWKARSDQASSSVLQLPEQPESGTPTKRVVEQLTQEPPVRGGPSRSCPGPARGLVTTVYVQVVLTSEVLVVEQPERLEADCSESTCLAVLAAEQRAFVHELGDAAAAGTYVDSPD